MYLKQLIIILLTVSHLIASLIQQNRLLIENTIACRIISQFNDYSIIYHYQNKYKSHVDSIISKAQINGTYLMANYDLHSDASNIILRPTGYRYLHVILLENYTDFSDYTSANQFPLSYVDVLLFLTNLDSQSLQEFKLWENNSLERAGGLFIFDYWTMRLFTVCFYCGNLNGRLRIVKQFYKNVTALVPELDGFINRFTDFNNHVFTIGYIDFKPFFWADIIVEEENYTLFNIFGSEGELLVLLHEELNIQFIMKHYSGSKDVWVTIIEAVENKTIDWAVGGITLTIQRAEVVDFTSSIQSEPYTILYSVYTDPWMAWQSIIIPFEFVVWLTILVTIGVIAALFYLAFKLLTPGKQLDYLSTVQSCLRFLVEQPMSSMNKFFNAKWSTIWLMSLWLMVAFIITNAYKSRLTSSLIGTRAEEPDSIDRLVELGYYFEISNEDSSVLQEYLRSSADQKFLEALKRTRNTTEFCDAVLKTVGQRIAVIDEETMIQYTVQEQCRSLMDLEDQQDLRLVKDELFPSQHAWPLQLATPYRARFNSIISRLNAGGIFIKWNSDYAAPAQIIPKSHQRRSSAINQKPKFTLASILGPGIIWTLGMFAAVISFVFEVLRCPKVY